MKNDIDLLRRYVEDASEEAFTEITRRHIDFVYGAALRQARNPHRAEDITQAVFTDLARKAATLLGRTELVGWLYVSTRYAATSVVRSEARREAREREARMNQDVSSNPNEGVDWRSIDPVLDAALSELGEMDRTALLLRFFKNQSFAEVGDGLRVSEEAARKRTDRALEKLRASLARRGVTSTAAAIAIALANPVVMAAPAGLIATVTSAALAGATPASAAGAATASGVFAFMKTTSVLIIAGLIVVGSGLTVYESRKDAELRGQIDALRLENDQLTSRVRIDADQLKKALSDLEAARRNNDEVSKLRAQLAATSQASAKPVDAPLRTIEQFANAGRATPDAAFETFYWAGQKGDMKALAGCMAFDPLGKEIIRRVFSTLSPDAKAFYGSPELMIAAVALSMSMTQMKKLDIVGVQQSGPDDAVLSYRRENDPRVRKQLMQNSADGWMVLLQGTGLEKQKDSEMATVAEHLAMMAKK